MNKFARPEIEVIRFNEADVIVASGNPNFIPNTMVIKNFNDGSANNGSITYNGVTYSYANNKIFNTFLFNESYRSNYWIETNNGNRVSFASLTESEGGNNPQENVAGTVADGSYTWDSANSIFRKQ